MYAELVAILALIAVLNLRSNQQSAELNARLVADSAVRLRQEVEEAKVFLDAYLLSKISPLKDGCKDLARTISGELAYPWWGTELEGSPVYDDAQWKRMKQLAEPVIGNLAEPDELNRDSKVLNAQADALKEELRVIIQRQSNIWEYNHQLGAFLLLAQSLLQILVMALLAVLMWSIKKDSSA